MKEKGENTKMDTYSGCLPRPNLDKIPQLCLLRKLTLHFSSVCVCHMNKVINRWSLSGKRMVVFCVLFCGKQQHEVKKFHLQKIVLFKKDLELLLEWAPDELVNQFAKKLETRNFRWHAFWKSQQEIPRNQSAALVANPIIIAERVKVYKLWHRLSSCLFGISVTY